jgi:hypothetical protein
MSDDVKGFIGLGFSIDELDPEENSIYSCDFHKLDEEQEAHPCPEELFAEIDLGNDREGLFLCKRHFSLFASDMLSAIQIFGEKAGGIADPSDVMTREGSILTYPGMVEIVMKTKDQLRGSDA